MKKFPSISCEELTNINQYKINKECLIIRRLSVDGINGGASASWGALWRSHQNWSKDWPFQAQATPLLLCFYAFLFVFLENSGKKMKEEMLGFFVGCFLMLLVSHQWRSQLNFANWVVVLGSVGWSFLNFIGNQTGTLLILTCFVFLTFRLVFVWLPRMERWRQINECWDFVGCAVPPFK